MVIFLSRAIIDARAGAFASSEHKFLELLNQTDLASERAVILNNLAVLKALQGDTVQACRELGELLENTLGCNNSSLEFNHRFLSSSASQGNKRRIAILSLFFNWPSTGGGIVHTKEVAEILHQAGYEIQHLYAKFADWRVGQVAGALPYPSKAVEFNASDWNPHEIRRRFSHELDDFNPDSVLITDSWNTKVLLAEAAVNYRYFLRIAALEGVCPLNNVRLLFDAERGIVQCYQCQLDSPEVCYRCVTDHHQQSGELHHLDRELAEFESRGYPERLKAAYQNAEAILVVNPEIADVVKTSVGRVEVIPSGFHRKRFPLPEVEPINRPGRIKILFAGLVLEFMKGFHVLAEAGKLLWEKRHDFEIVATAEPSESGLEFVRYVGWQSQEQLPNLISECDILVFPTIAQEALGRTAVEGMACRRPVVASRIGGLSWVVEDGKTGLLFEPGNPSDLANKLTQLMDSPEMRVQLGGAGREKFEKDFTWDGILNRYVDLFGPPNLSTSKQTSVAMSEAL